MSVRGKETLNMLYNPYIGWLLIRAAIVGLHNTDQAARPGAGGIHQRRFQAHSVDMTVGPQRNGAADDRTFLASSSEATSFRARSTASRASRP